MNLDERIARRQTGRNGRRIIVDREQLSPVVHPRNPVGRGPVFERLLDAVEPSLDGGVPEDFVVAGPPGSGKSAVVTALFKGLDNRLGQSGNVIGTTTRAGSGSSVTWFLVLDARRVQSAFALYRTLLSTVTTESVPQSGIGTDELRAQLQAELEQPERQIVVAIDHHDEPDTLTFDRVSELLTPVDDSCTLVAIGQQTPPGWTGQTIAVPTYRHHELVDVITERASAGLAAGALDHELTRELATWADGNVHDALAALFSAAVLASNGGRERIETHHLKTAMADVPEDSVHVDRALALSETRQQVLRDLISLEAVDNPIRDVAADIAVRSSLTAGTVKRFLYELADLGVIERVPLPSNGSGRRPSTVELRFPTIPFLTLSPEPARNR